MKSTIAMRRKSAPCDEVNLNPLTWIDEVNLEIGYIRAVLEALDVIGMTKDEIEVSGVTISTLCLAICQKLDGLEQSCNAAYKTMQQLNDKAA